MRPFQSKFSALLSCRMHVASIRALSTMLGCILFSSMQMVALLGQESSELTESQIAAATPEQLQGLAETGDARAQFSLGLAYFNGRVVSKDLRKASIWFEKAAEQGHLSAQYNLGVLFVQGFGVDKDFADDSSIEICKAKTELRTRISCFS